MRTPRTPGRSPPAPATTIRNDDPTANHHPGADAQLAHPPPLACVGD
ncbi:hypothetical protein [Gulosibacter sp. ACHW.36C]|uniref:Uncharacterized protein n=1 Tax=Gulosibacter sediminis TaxID=1729695 RepID=A0ABY4MUX7_9MICO|nr:hypothetical protein [Gulosibacter sediminis]UQN14221.1 hypothetical protein M3M28_09185 [Gulosibacter sediminis]